MAGSFMEIALNKRVFRKNPELRKQSKDAGSPLPPLFYNTMVNM
jgi:hypothetical protein